MKKSVSSVIAQSVVGSTALLVTCHNTRIRLEEDCQGLVPTVNNARYQPRASANRKLHGGDHRRHWTASTQLAELGKIVVTVLDSLRFRYHDNVGKILLRHLLIALLIW